MNNIPTYNSFAELALANGCAMANIHNQACSTVNSPLRLHRFLTLEIRIYSKGT